MLYGILSVAAAAVLAGIDQWIKAWATANLLPVGAMSLIPGIVELRYSLNQGMAFSLLWGRQGFLIAVTSSGNARPWPSASPGRWCWAAAWAT